MILSKYLRSQALLKKILLIIIKNYIMRLFILLLLLNSVLLTSCGPLWVKGANKTFGQKKQKSKYSRPRGDIRLINATKTAYV